jgi:hypothetical protein
MAVMHPGNLCQKEICRVTLSKSVHCIERAAERGLLT